MAEKEAKKDTKKTTETAKKTTKAASSAKAETKAAPKAKKADSNGFAIIETGGKQYKVSSGTILEFEKLEGEAQKSVTFDKVLLVSDGKDVKIGQPYVEGAKVKGTILEQKRDKKVLVFKFKKKTGYKKTQGHRQYLTTVKIDAI
jgi:large subunit ribosomal protein L21